MTTVASPSLRPSDLLHPDVRARFESLIYAQPLAVGIVLAVGGHTVSFLTGGEDRIATASWQAPRLAVGWVPLPVHVTYGLLFAALTISIPVTARLGLRALTWACWASSLAIVALTVLFAVSAGLDPRASSVAIPAYGVLAFFMCIASAGLRPPGTTT